MPTRKDKGEPHKKPKTKAKTKEESSSCDEEGSEDQMESSSEEEGSADASESSCDDETSSEHSQSSGEDESEEEGSASEGASDEEESEESDAEDDDVDDDDNVEADDEEEGGDDDEEGGDDDEDTEGEQSDENEGEVAEDNGNGDSHNEDENDAGIAVNVTDGLAVVDDDEGDDEEGGDEVVGGKTKKGEERLRNYHWTSNEKHALFYSLLKHESIIKKKGPDPEQLRDKAWQEVLDAVNAVDDHSRDMKQLRKKINTYYSSCNKKNANLLERLKANKKVRKGLNATELLCLKWKQVPEAVGPKGVVVYTKKRGKTTTGKTKKKIVKKEAVKESVAADPKKKLKKKKEHVDPDTIVKISKKVTVKGQKKEVKDADRKPKVQSEKTVKCVKKTIKREPSTPVKSELPDIKTPKGKTTAKKTTPKKTPPKKTPPKKTIRGRKPLPDMDIEAFYPYQTGSLFKESQKAKKSEIEKSLKEDSGDDDLSVAYISTSPGTGLIDLTSVPFTSTPNVITVGTPEDKPKQEVRRSPRNVKDSTKAETVKQSKKASKVVQGAPLAKKSLSYSPKGKGPLKCKDKTQPKPSTSGTVNATYSGREFAMDVDDKEDVSVRLAKLESLLITNELDRRDERKERKALESRILDLLEQKEKQEEVFIKGYQFCLENQKKIIQVMGYLSGVVDAKSKMVDKRVQTLPCPYLDAQPLVVEEADKDGKVIKVRAVSSTSGKSTPVVISPGGHIKIGALDLTVTGAVAESIKDPVVQEAVSVEPGSEQEETVEQQPKEGTQAQPPPIVHAEDEPSQQETIQPEEKNTCEQGLSMNFEQLEYELPQPQYCLSVMDIDTEIPKFKETDFPVKEEIEDLGGTGCVDHVLEGSVQQVLYEHSGLNYGAPVGQLTVVNSEATYSGKEKETETAAEEPEETTSNKKARLELNDENSLPEEEEEDDNKRKTKVTSKATRRPRRKTTKKR